MRPILPVPALLAVLLALSHGRVAIATEVQGWFAHGGQRAQLDHGVALRFRDPEAGGQPRLVVLLAQAAPDPERGRGKRNPLGNIEAGLPFDAARLVLHLDDARPSPAIERLAFGGLVVVRPEGASLQVVDDRLRGEWQAGPGDGGRAWQASLRLDLPVVDLAAD